MKEFRYIGLHADELEGGRPVAPGEYTGSINERARQNKMLIDAGLLLPVEDGTTERVALLDAAATKKGEPLTDEEWTLDHKKLSALASDEEKGVS